MIGLTITNMDEIFSNWSTNSEKSLYTQNEKTYDLDSPCASVLNIHKTINTASSNINGKFNNINTFNASTLVRSAYDWTNNVRV